MNEEAQKASEALRILIEAVEIGQAAGVYTIADSAQIFAALRFFNPDYGNTPVEDEIETKKQEAEKSAQSIQK